MTIRKKFFLLAGTLLALFGTVIGILALTQKLDRDQLANISQYEQPLSQLIAEFDVYTDRYELEVLRVLRSGDLSPNDREVAGVAVKRLGDELRKSLVSSQALLLQATKDQRFDTEDRIELARIGGVLKYLSRDLEDFLGIGETTLAEAKDTFGKFLDPRLVTRLIASGADQAERRSVTIFFSDIKQFTGISEQLTASTIVHLLNEYFGAVAKVIHGHRGIIDKYIGDAVMAFWVPPFSAGDDHARDACRAALAQQEAIAALQARLPEITGMRRNAPELVIRMGIATGEAVVGTIGSEAARSYTVIGDSVNLASRLEGINSVYGTLLMIGEETYRLAQEDIEAREVDVITVAGKMEPVRIYELMSAAGQLQSSRLELRETFTDGLASYRRRDWDGAQAYFEECLRTAPDDGPARVFLDRISVLRSSPPGPDWDGVWHYDKK